MAFAHRLLRVIEDGALPANAIVQAHVEHSSWCGAVATGESCLCDPKITITHKGRVFEVDLEGTLLEVS